MRGISWLAANQLAAEEGLCTVEWVRLLLQSLFPNAVLCTGILSRDRHGLEYCVAVELFYSLVSFIMVQFSRIYNQKQSCQYKYYLTEAITVTDCGVCSWPLQCFALGNIDFPPFMIIDRCIPVKNNFKPMCRCVLCLWRNTFLM